MPTLTELKKLATKHTIKGRSKMNKAELETALNIKHKSRKARVKKSRKARVKKSRKARSSKRVDQKMLEELKLLQKEVSAINNHRINHLKSQHKRIEKNYNKYTKKVKTRMKQRLKRVDKSINVYEKAARKNLHKM